MMKLERMNLYQPNQAADYRQAADFGVPMRSIQGKLSLSEPTVASSEGQEGFGKGSKNDALNFDRINCETCKNRKYQDGSDDPGVSFQTPTALDPKEAAVAVRSHENEHVGREKAAALREGREVVSQSVAYHTGVCPECGSVYVSGGTTRTVTKKQVDQTYGLLLEVKGAYLDITA